MVSINFPTETLIAGFAYSAIAILVVASIVIFARQMYLKKYVYIYRAKVLALRDNDKLMVVGTFPAGVIRGKNGVNDFCIKYGKFNPKAKIYLGYLPDYSKSHLTANGKTLLTFIRLGDATFLQQINEVPYFVEREVTEVIDGQEKKEKVIEYNLLIKPLGADVKTVTLNKLAEAKKALLSDTVRTTAIVFGALIIMVIGHLIWTWLIQKG